MTSARQARPIRRLGLAACAAVAACRCLTIQRGCSSSAFLAVPSGSRPPSGPQREPTEGRSFWAASAAALALATGGESAVHAAGIAGVAEVASSEALALNPVDAVVQAFALTFVSEIGDKTFFIAAILAGGSGADGNSKGLGQKALTFVGAISALAVMTLIAVSLGQLFHYVPDLAGGLPLDDYASILAFGYFGVKLLTDASTMSDDSSLDEKSEAEEAVKDLGLPSWVENLSVPPVVLQAFVLVLAAEVGDRSFISAAALSAQGGPPGAASVFIGAIAAHAIATLLAVLLGELISTYVSEKTLTTVGGVLFLFFAATSTANVLGVISK